MDKMIVGIGEILWDVFPERKVLGGAPANFAYHGSQLGLKGYAISAIGNDSLGMEILSSMADKQLDYILESTDYPTGTVQVTLDDLGVPCYEICENVAWDNIPWTRQLGELAQRTEAVCFGSLAQRSEVSRTTINQFVDLVPESALKIFDINLRQHFYSKKLIHNSLMKCNVLKINDDEVKAVSGLYNWNSLPERDVCRQLLNDYSLKMLILTKGTQGSFVMTPLKSDSFFPTPVVRVADTVGAGDSFTGAFVAAILSGKDIGTAHQLAVEVSAYVCTQHGAMPELPDKYLKSLQ